MTPACGTDFRMIFACPPKMYHCIGALRFGLLLTCQTVQGREEHISPNEESEQDPSVLACSVLILPIIISASHGAPITPPKPRDQTLSLLHPIHRLPGSVPLTVSAGRKRSSIHTVQYDAWSCPCLSGQVVRVPTENQINGLPKLVQFDFGGQASQGEGRPHDVPSHHNTGPRVSVFFSMLLSESSRRDKVHLYNTRHPPVSVVCRHCLPDSIHPLSCRMT
jgi:hypothetical protein